MPKPSALERFWKNVNRTSGCWLWTAGVNNVGYGQFWAHGKPTHAHRFSYETHIGPIPEGLVIDHACFTRACVNPAHLEAVSVGENAQRKSGPSSNNRSSGVRGVYRNGKNWIAKMGHDGVVYNLGTYPTIEEAAAVVEAKRAQLVRPHSSGVTRAA